MTKSRRAAPLLRFQPRSDYGRFGLKLYFLLVENFPATYFVGGMVRDLLLGRTIKDIDVATVARPEQICALLEQNRIAYDALAKRFGIIFVPHRSHRVEIATFRTDRQTLGRYPKVSFVTTPRLDSRRRDFTINSLYLSQKTGKVLDFHNGLRDLKQRLIRFIDKPEERIKQDPLRIIRAVRLHYELKFSFTPATIRAIKKNLPLLDMLTVSRRQKEINKIANRADRIKMMDVINNKANLT